MLALFDPSTYKRTPPPLRVWGLVGLLLLAVACALEVGLRAGALWRLPLRVVLQEPSDVNTRAVWRIYNTPPDPREVIVVGSSMADAVVEPEGVVRQETFDAVLGPGQARVLNLAVNRSCYPEQTVVLENALRRGHRPARVVIFSWPGCVAYETGDDRMAPLMAENFPLTSDFLDAHTPAGSLDESIGRWLTRHSALVRFRLYGNGWLRQRMKMALRGRPFVRRFRPDDRTGTWQGPWTADTNRREQLATLRDTLEARGTDMRPLTTLLQFVRQHEVRAVLVEVPWSPSIREYFAGCAWRYRSEVARVAAQYGVPYLDLNADAALGSEHFHDSYHVNTKGAARYLRALLTRLDGMD